MLARTTVLGSRPKLHGEGDSYMEGAGGASFGQALRNAGYSVRVTAQGSSSITQIRDRILANLSEIRNCTLVVWDGRLSAGDPTDAAEYADILEPALNAVGKFIVVPLSAPYGVSSTTQEEAFRDEYMRRWPTKTYDWRRNIPTTNGKINQDQQLFHLGSYDNVHLSQEAYNSAAFGLKGML
jgi:hypothetical protein